MTPITTRIAVTYGVAVVKNESVGKLIFHPHKPAPLWFRVWSAVWPAAVMVVLYAIWLLSTIFTIVSVAKLMGVMG